MSPFPFLDRVKAPPRPFDAAKARGALADLKRFASGKDGGDLKPLLADARGTRLLAAVFGNSPYLTRLILRDPNILLRLLAYPPEHAAAEINADLARECAGVEDLTAVMRILRVAKTHAALLIALADIGGAWPLDTVTGALTEFADAAVSAALRFILRGEAAAGRLQIADIEAPERDCGLIVLAMGKYGAHELNYSSDIDLIVFFANEVWRVADGQDAQSVAVRVTQALVRALSEQTADGYVFRTDLRLRPDAGATQIALSTAAAEIYYESMGQNWERAAMIKARPCAGDLAAGERFMASLKPFLWRKHLDFAAIEDIHSIKRQINAHKGHANVAVAGHNLKLGRGGIREIEFFVQTQQLILGGREPELRGRTTCGVLETLAEKGFVAAETARELTDDYRTLRTIEHRLQMIEDAQTHSLPKDKGELTHVALFCGYESVNAFERAVFELLKRVQRHYAALFENAPPLAENDGNLVFTGVDDDEGTLESLTAMGFKRAKEVSAAIRSWHHGRMRATRSARAREILTNLVPPLLRALAASGDPDNAFFRFHSFLEGLPAGVQVLSLLLQNITLLDLLVSILASAPRLAGYLSRNAAVLDAFLEPDYLAVLPGSEELAAGFDAMVKETRDYQDILDGARRYAREQRFRVGLHVLFNTADAAEAGHAHAEVAECVLLGLIPPTRQAFEEKHGRIAGGGMAIVGLGKFGGYEMTATSDLDLVAIYDGDPEASSNGPRALSTSDYFARLSQRIINALTAPTAAGQLYAVDMRLRPSGNAGPIATKLEGFKTYQLQDAWTWEHMALTRARVIAGDETVRKAVRAAIDHVLSLPREPSKTARDVVEMRARISKEYPSKDPWELKYVRGGLIDLEFMAQYLGLVHAAANPGILSTNTAEMLRRLGQHGVLDPARMTRLVMAAEVLHSVLQILRVSVDGPFVPAEAPQGLARALAAALDVPNLSGVERVLIDAQAEIFGLWSELVEQAAQSG